MALSKSKVAIGIDLGTTNTCVSVWKDGVAEVIPNKIGAFVTPSWVTYTTNELLIRQIAKDNAYKHLYSALFGIKSIIGRQFEDPAVQNAIENWKFKVAKDDSGLPRIEVRYNNQTHHLYPEEVSGLILREMKEIAEAYLEESNITDAVITVPAYFNDHQRQATKDAAKIAGLNVLRLINEPTAAAIDYVYGKEQKKERNVLVYDLGGGTFDVSIVSLEDGNVRVRATLGDTNLGGRNFDDRCVKHFLNVIENKHKLNVNLGNASGLRLLRRLENQAERVKQDLSSSYTTVIELSNVNGDFDLSEELSRARFDDLNDDLYRKTVNIVEHCIKEAKLEKEEIDDIALAGGSTRIIKIQDNLEKFFGKPVSRAINPDQAVARGAAILAAHLNGTLPLPLNVMDVMPMSLGIETLNGEMDILIPRNSQIPTQEIRTYTSGVEGDDSIRITILEGDNRIAKENLKLGFFDLYDLPKNPTVDVTFHIDVSGILTVNAIETSSGISNMLNVTLNKGRLSEKEIKLLRQHSNILQKKNKQWNDVKDKRNKFETYLMKTKDDVDAYEISATQKKIILNMVEEAMSWMATEDAYDITKIDKRYYVIYKYCTMILNGNE